MSIASGTKIGPYEVTAALGAGGMGEVYRARDARLGRDVAVKVLPDSFAADAERLRRFEQEARATGLLNHPNILAVYDIGTHGGAPYVVSELLEGETLRDRIGGTPLPTRKAIDFATQIAKGLSAAHEKGIVHRDLKPENLFLTKDGRVKILDFGLAKLADGEALSEAETNTRGMPGTDAGKVLGTVGYMSPEQVRAKPVDHRSDIFAFGSVFYEMLSGRRAFRGESAIETMNAILKEDPPDLTETNRQLPAALEHIVAHCLEKNPEERFQSARDIAFDLEQLSGSAAHAALAPVAERGFRHWRLAAVALGTIAVATLAFVAGRGTATHALPEFQPITFRRGVVNEARFAPDGRSIVYSATWQGVPANVYTAQAGKPESRSLELPNAELVAVSRSGEMAVLIARETSRGRARTLARLPMGGSAPRDLTERITNADWAPDGTSLAVIRREGGRDRLEFPIGKPLYEAVYIGLVRVSPGGDLVAFTDHPLAGDNRGDVAVVDLTGKRRALSTDWSDIRGLAWSPDGSEVWFTATRQGIEQNLWAVTLGGQERQVYRAPGNMAIQDCLPDGRVLLTVGRTKPSIFGRAPGETEDRDLSWLDWGLAAALSADGRTFLFDEQGDGGGPEYATYVRGTDGSAPVLLGKGHAIALSPDGRFALVVDLRAPSHLSLLPTGSGEVRPLPRGRVAQFQWGAFLPDGKRIVFTGNEDGKGPRLFVQDLAGGDPKPFSPEGVFALEGDTVTPDGAFVAAQSDAGIALYPVSGGEPRPVVGGETGDELLRVSRDGRLLYVGRFPRPRRLPYSIYRIDLQTGARELWKELSPAGASTLGSVNAVAIAPEAGAYAYSYFEAMTTLYEVRGLR
ncbi:MAG TPA: protein kinase [Vicinamibacteria bacterium]|nr:protein kinase [Vicinamibacteria bacterium]